MARYFYENSIVYGSLPDYHKSPLLHVIEPDGKYLDVRYRCSCLREGPARCLFCDFRSYYMQCPGCNHWVHSQIGGLLLVEYCPKCFTYNHDGQWNIIRTMIGSESSTYQTCENRIDRFVVHNKSDNRYYDVRRLHGIHIHDYQFIGSYP